jgi:hypothetical protein
MPTSTMTPLSLVEQLNGLHVGVALWSTSDVRILEDNNDLATAAASSWPITERLRPPQGGSPARLAPTLRSSECDHLGPPRRARPRLVRVRLADNLRGAPGGPADPNGTWGGPSPGDRWINGLPRGSTPAGRGRRESRSRGGSPASLAPGRESLMRVGGTPRELSTVYSQWSSGSAARQALRTERWRRQRDP